MQVTALPLRADNYAWLLQEGPHAWVVDPSDAAPVLDRIRAASLVLDGILLTHHHGDHVGGVPGLIAALGPVPVLCSARDLPRIPGATRGLSDGEQVSVLGRRAVALHVPGHTEGAVAWHLADEAVVFTGDTLFTGGCGRLFEGTPAQMAGSLSRLRELPPRTRVCCGHEYTVANLTFAAGLEPGNAAVARRLEAARAARDRAEPTVPALLSEERATNPFLRFDDPDLVRRLGAPDALAAFTELRARKDRF